MQLPLSIKGASLYLGYSDPGVGTPGK